MRTETIISLSIEAVYPIMFVCLLIIWRLRPKRKYKIQDISYDQDGNTVFNWGYTQYYEHDSEFIYRDQHLFIEFSILCLTSFILLTIFTVCYIIQRVQLNKVEFIMSVMFSINVFQTVSNVYLFLICFGHYRNRVIL